MPPTDLLEVVIIGAGPAGLSAAKELLAACPNLRNQGNNGGDQHTSLHRKIVVLEESDAVGGMWHRSGGVYRSNNCSDDYTSDNDVDNDNDTSSSARKIPVTTSCQPIYNDLVANLPKHMMCFRDMIYSHDVPTMPRPHHVQQYFHRYSTVHDLLPCIQFQSRVVQCNKVTTGDDGEESHWEILALEGQVEGSAKKEVMYRSRRLVVCIGHHRKAYIPTCIRGVRHYRGEMLHSSAFRSPNQFDEGGTILIVGGGISGIDIANMLLRSGRKVLVSVREWRFFPHGILLNKMKKKGMVRHGISHFDEDGTVHFGPANDTNIICSLPTRPDAIIFATGYRYDYPFLPKDGGFIRKDGFKMCRLYLRILYANDPSLAFMQVPTMTLSAIMLAEYQSRWYAQYVRGKLNITVESMEAEIFSRKDDLTQDNMRIIAGYIPYINSLARMTGDYTFWGQMMSIRFPMMIQSLWVAVKRTLPSIGNSWR